MAVTILRKYHSFVSYHRLRFRFVDSYQTSDGVSREEKAEVKNPGAENEALVVQGSYSYVGTDGNTYTITYVADENGYRPTGQHIPGGV